MSKAIWSKISPKSLIKLIALTRFIRTDEYDMYWFEFHTSFLEFYSYSVGKKRLKRENH